ncbi:MAG: hypothetical protein ACYTFG_01900 [Planctomycetota bacterium]|jgi:hypothetical protein
MSEGPGLYRTCKSCGNDYKASRPACPNCGKPPFTKRNAYAVTGPRMMVLIGFFFFAVWAAYGFILSPEQYERYRAILFGMPRVVSQVGGTVGALVFLAINVYVFLGGRSSSSKEKSPRSGSPRKRGVSGGSKP